MKNLKIFLLGNPKIFMNEKNLSEQLSNKALGLLLYLATNRGKKINRDKLAELFWGDNGAEASNYNLRYNLWALKKIVDVDAQGNAIIMAEKNTLYMNPDCNCFIDLEMYNHYKDTEDLEQLLYLKNLYKGNFLESFVIKKCFDFNDWIFYEREKYQRCYLKILISLQNHYTKVNDFANCIDILKEMIQFNPLNEDLYEILIKLYLKQGDRNSALYIYKKCVSLLREELNISPNTAIKNLYNDICDQKKSTDHNHKIKSVKISILDENAFHEYMNQTEQKDKIVLKTSCFPLNNISYYYLSGLVEEVMNNVSDETLSDIPVLFWKDIVRLDNSVIRFINSTHDDEFYLTALTEKNRIFNSLMHLLCHISQKCELHIFIKNFHWIDEISFEFIKYFLFKQTKFRGQLFLSSENMLYVEQLETFFEVER